MVYPFRRLWFVVLLWLELFASQEDSTHRETVLVSSLSINNVSNEAMKMNGTDGNALYKLSHHSSSSSIKLQLFNSLGSVFSFAGTGASGYTGDSGQAALATLSTPNGLFFDPSVTGTNVLYIADWGNNFIR